MAGVPGRPQLSPEGVLRLLAAFGISGEGVDVSDMPSFDDLNFRVRAADGRQFVLKVHNSLLPSGSRCRLEAQNRFIARLRQGGLPVPEVVPSLSGDLVVTVEQHCAGACAPTPLARLLTFLEGRTLPNEEPKSCAFLEGVGEVAGRVAGALQGYEDEGQRWTWDWDMKCVPEVVRGKLHCIKDDSRRSLASRLADDYAATVVAAAPSLPHSVIHSDLNDTNLLYLGEEMSGVLDFGDTIYSCTVFDPAIAAGYHSLGQDDPMRVLCAVLRGYTRTAPVRLGELEREVYFHAARGRVLLSVAFAAENATLEPDNEYLLHTAEPGWAVLEKLGNLDVSAALSQLRDALQ